VSRLPIRLRLTGAFAAAMAAVLAAIGFVLYQHLAASLDRSIDQGLRARADLVTTLMQQADTGLREAGPIPFAANGFAQVLDARGRVVDRSPGPSVRPLLDSVLLQRALRGALTIRRGPDNSRLLAAPISAQDQRLVVVVGSPLDVRDEALAGFRQELLLGGPVALLLASLIGYWVAAAALRPVERMRSRASTISANRLAERLPVGGSGDEIARLGETLNDLLARMEDALERERSFVADASHELRTPLAHLSAEVELALEGRRTRAELETALRSVADESVRLTQLAEDLLLLARLDRGALPVRLGDVEVGEMLGSVAARFERRARDAGREIVSDGGGLRIGADRLRLEQALGNLVENALRHGEGTIALTARLEDGSVRLEVADEGPGFPADFLPHAFERFARAERSRTSAGTGLGLAIVRAVAEAHGGTAGAAGAAAWLALPYVEGRVSRAESSSREPMPSFR
jgi:heavy metal sensor kinase